MLMTDLILQEILRKEFGSYLLEEDFVIQHYACGKIPGLNK